VTLTRLPSDILLEVCDDGIGFNPSAPPAGHGHHGLGLLGMRERMRMVSGELTIVSAHGCGTQVQAQAPLPPNALRTDAAPVAPLQVAPVKMDLGHIDRQRKWVELGYCWRMITWSYV
jgi:signal transduction histidine kinase